MDEGKILSRMWQEAMVDIEKYRENLWNELKENLNIIGGRKMEAPKRAAIESVVREEAKIDEIEKEIKSNIDLWMKGYRAKIEAKMHEQYAKIQELENQNVVLVRLVVKHRKREAQVAEVMGWQKSEKK